MRGDPVGYEEAADLWRSVVKGSTNPAVLFNAARFFLASEPASGLELAEAAALHAPGDAEWSGHLGSSYAYVLLGLVEGVPPGRCKSPPDELAARVRASLEASRNSEVLREAARILSGLGSRCFEDGEIAWDSAELAGRLRLRAVSTATDEQQKVRALQDVIGWEVRARRWDRVRSVAEQMLALDNASAKQLGHIYLGIECVQRSDREGALSHVAQLEDDQPGGLLYPGFELLSGLIRMGEAATARKHLLRIRGSVTGLNAALVDRLLAQIDAGAVPVDYARARMPRIFRPHDWTRPVDHPQVAAARGKRLLVVISTAGCRPCQEYLTTVRSWSDQSAVPVVVIDPEQDTSSYPLAVYDVTAYPTTFWVDENGVVQRRASGPQTVAALASGFGR